MSLEELTERLESRHSSTLVRGGMGPLSLLGVAFVVLKLIGQISWSWWWVLAPFWIPLSIALLLCIIGAIILGVGLHYEKQALKEATKDNKKPAKKSSSKKKKEDGSTKKNG